MRFAVTYVAGVAVVAAIDGALLTGVAAIITSIGGIALGLMAYRRGKTNGAAGDPYRMLAEERGREIRRLRLELRRRDE